jgi:lipopolysaccharide export system permease protein
LSAAFVFGEAGIYPPRIGVWVPNLVLGGIGIYLLRQAARERPVIPPALHGWLHRMQPILSRFTG